MRATTPFCAIVVLALGLGSVACQGGNRSVVGSGPEAGNQAADAGGAAGSGTPADAGRTGSAAAGAPTATPAPTFKDVTIPAGTELPLVLDTGIASDRSRVEEVVEAHLLDPVVVDGVTVLATGTPVTGVVTAAEQAGKVKGRAQLGVRFDSLTGPDGQRYTIATTGVDRTARATKGKDALKIGGGAAGGAIVGGLIGGKKGAAIGTAAGGGAGTALVLSTRGEEVRMPRGTALRVRLSEPTTVRVPQG